MATLLVPTTAFGADGSRLGDYLDSVELHPNLLNALSEPARPTFVPCPVCGSKHAPSIGRPIKNVQTCDNGHTFNKITLEVLDGIE